MTTTAMQLPPGSGGYVPPSRTSPTATPSTRRSWAEPKFESTRTPSVASTSGHTSARCSDPAFPAEREHSGAGADGTLRDRPGGRLGDRAHGVVGGDVERARVVEPRVVALTDDGDHDVVDANARSRRERGGNGAVEDTTDLHRAR